MAWQDREYNREGSSFNYRFGFTPPSPMSLVVMAVCFVTFVLQSLSRGYVTYYGQLTLDHNLAFTQPWRWITYQYLHSGALHIFLNLLGIYFFLPSLERLWGWKKAFAFYTLGGIAAGILYAIICSFGPARGSLIGASGSILAAIGACALLFPEKQMLLFFFPVPLRVFAILVGLLFTLSIIGEGDLSAAAHLGGLLFGFAAPMWGRPALGSFTKSMARRGQQRAVDAERDEQATIDRILVKVHEQGMNSLNRGERSALKRATDRQRDRETKRVRRA